MLRYCIVTFFVFTAVIAAGQLPVRITITDTISQKGIPSVTISENGSAVAKTDSTGTAVFKLLPGKYWLSFSSIGYSSKKWMISVPANPAGIQVFLSPAQQIMEDVIIIASSRTNQRMENSPLKVEVLGHQEMEEENTIKPANIASILGDVSGIQIQQTSAVSGNASIRIQGLEGRYTQVLRDGLPLFDGFSGGFGILSIPPLDLKQVELIKGSASTLYGGGAIGGLVNIISRRPTAKQEITFTLNQTTLKESNVNMYAARRFKHMGYTLFGGFTRQKAVDVNKDGYSDLAQLDGLVLHPRLFFYPDANTTIITGYTAAIEARKGGDMLAIANKDIPAHQYFEKNTTLRQSGEFLLERKLKHGKRLEIKAALSSFDRTITTNTSFFKGNQLTYFSEMSLFIPYGNNSFVAGLNSSGDRFKKLQSAPIPLPDFSNNSIGIFAQNTWQLTKKSILEAGLRNDYHDKYGNFFLPRVSLFDRFNVHWATRFGIGWGYKIPNPLAPQVIDYPIEKIQPLNETTRAERSVGYNAELNYKKQWGDGNAFFINYAFFLTQINTPFIGTELSNGELVFSNAPKPILTKGFDTYIQATIEEWEVYAGYTFTVAKRTYLQQNQFMPLTPKNRMAFTVVKEIKESWRAGLEGSYNGYQHRLDGTKTPGYFFMAGLIEKKFGKHISLVLNGENLLDFRQSKKEALFTGNSSNPSFVALWGPIDGRVINLAVRVKI